MEPNRRPIVGAFLATMLGIGMLGGGAHAEGAKPAARAPLAPPVKVVVGTIGSASDVGFFIAADRGYFKDEGLDVHLEFLQSAAKMVPALATNDIQVASGGLNAGLVNAIDRDIPLRIVADKGTLRPGSGYQAFLVRKDLADKVKDFKDLKGLKVATSGGLRTIDAIIVRNAVERGGLTLKDVEVVDLAFPEMVTALAKGAIDVALVIEPFATTAIGQNSAVRWKSADEVAPNLQIAAVYYGPKFMSEQGEAAKRFMVAYVRAIRDYNDEMLNKKNPDAVIAVLTKFTRIKDPATYKKIVPPYIGPNAEVSAASLKTAVDEWASRNLVAKVDVAKLMDDQYLRYAWAQLGKK
ncbi:MAG TPA: ABC transporter substrate-binding protein [Alphaproteobacteria bacterium]|jgi:NitT/TauT family transport system substrate-binding protein|nr:ABC transporter substrate-binding protein [Alphaproteobacteria bacterium]